MITDHKQNEKNWSKRKFLVIRLSEWKKMLNIIIYCIFILAVNTCNIQIFKCMNITEIDQKLRKRRKQKQIQYYTRKANVVNVLQFMLRNK